MPKKSNRYRGAAERARGGSALGKGAPRSSGRLGRLRSALGAIRARIHRPHPGRKAVVLGALSLAVVLGVGSLGAGWAIYRNNHDWTAVASVNGHAISREALRGRMAVLALLAQERSSFIAEGVLPGNLTAEQVAVLRNGIAGAATLDAARESLIDDELLRQLAARDGVATPASPDPWVEATAYASSDTAHRIRFIRFGLPSATTSSATPSPTPSSSPSPSASATPAPTATPTPAPTATLQPSPAPSAGAGATAAPWPAATQANVDAATARARAELTAGTPAETIVARLHDAGWQVFGEDVSVSADGVPADSTLALEPEIATGATTAKLDGIVGPAPDSAGRTSLARVLGSPDIVPLERRLPFDADTAKVELSAIQSWADGQALRRAVTASLLSAWRSKGVNQAHFRELVIGPAPDSSSAAGPWVELSQLYLDRLAGVSPASITGAPAGLSLSGDALARTLNSMSQAARATLFRSLVAAANKPPAPASSNTSGEVGFYTKDGLIPAIGGAAFDPATHTGQVIGPISTATGPELFLVETRYGGSLDERSKAALGQIRSDPTPDLAAYTTRFSPTDAALAIDAGWRSEPEFGSTEAIHSALFDTEIGVLSDPFVLDGKLALAVVTERRTAVPDARSLARLALDGYSVWFDSELAKATITRSDNPLPELMPSPTATSSSSIAPELPSMPALDTPNLPVIPGQPAATPVPTDAMGLPVLP
ncbi:MAG: hypothetical protein ABSB75_02275 [Candidatus Limnocylindrales bacterium]